MLLYTIHCIYCTRHLAEFGYLYIHICMYIYVYVCMYGSIRCISIYRYLYVEYLCIHSNPKNAEFDSERVMHNFSFFWGELLTLSLSIYMYTPNICVIYISCIMLILLKGQGTKHLAYSI